MDLEIKMKRKNQTFYDRPRIKWDNSTPVRAQVMGEKLVTMGAWGSIGDATIIWDRTVSYIREAAREVLGVSRGISGRQ